MGYEARAMNGERARELTQRKFQQVAVNVIDQHAGAIGQLVEAINQTNEAARVSREFVADLSGRVDAQDATCRYLAAEDVALLRRLSITESLAADTASRQRQFERQSFWSRLRWLFTGQ